MPDDSEVTYEVETFALYWDSGHWDRHLPSLEAARDRVTHITENATADGDRPPPTRIRKVTREVVEVVNSP